MTRKSDANRIAAAGPGWPAAKVLAVAEAFTSREQALNLFALRLAENGWLPAGRCAQVAALPWSGIAAELSALRARTGGVLPPWAAARRVPAAAGAVARDLLAGPAPAASALSAVAEVLLAGPLTAVRRRGTGLYFTPPELAAQVVEVALAQGGVDKVALPSVVDPCVGAGAFLAAAARATAPRADRRDSALACSGADLSPFALAAARATLALEAGPAATAADLRGLRLRELDSLFAEAAPPADLLVSNPPYGHLDDPEVRARIAERYPALRGGEIDRYAAFLLRSLELVKPGGTAALLVPDTWMTNARGGGLRAALLERAELAAVVDLGKPFASAKDTRVQAVVLVRREQPRARATFVARRREARLEPLAPLDREQLLRTADRGWQPYRTAGERDLCAAIEAASVPIGALAEVGYGLRTGDNRRHLTRVEEVGGVPLLGGEDLVPYAVRWRPKWLRAASRADFRALIDKQAGLPRVAIQRIRTNSSQPWARWLEAAICPPGLVCLDSLSTLSCADEELLWALLGLVSSVALDRVHRLRTTDVNVKPSALRELPAPVRLREPGPRRALAELVRQRAREAEAHVRDTAAGPAASATRPTWLQAGAKAAPLAPALERRIDRAVYDLYGLSAGLIEIAERGFWGERHAVEGPRL